MIKRIDGGIACKSSGFNYLLKVEKLANKFELKGIVFIKNDGSIKIIAEGEEENLGKFARDLERENFFTPIENFYMKWLDAREEFKIFHVIDRYQ